MITEEQHFWPQNAFHQYLHGDYGYPDIEKVMESVFRDNHTTMDTTEWSHYWTALTIYCEQLEGGDLTMNQPMV